MGNQYSMKLTSWAQAKQWSSTAITQTSPFRLKKKEPIGFPLNGDHNSIQLCTIGSSLPAMGQLSPAPAITQVSLLTPIVSHPAPPPLVQVSTTSTNTQAITPVAVQPSTSITLTSPLPTPFNSNEPNIMPTMPVGMFMGDSMLPLPDSVLAKNDTQTGVCGHVRINPSHGY